MEPRVNEELINLLKINSEVLAKVHEVLSRNDDSTQASRRPSTAKSLQNAELRSGGSQTPGSSPERDTAQTIVNTLDPVELDEAGFESHLRTYPWRPRLLDWLQGSLIIIKQERAKSGNGPSLLSIKFDRDTPANPDQYTHWDIFDVASDGSMLPIPGTVATSLTKVTAVWAKLARVNASSANHKAHGRVVVLRDPSPLIFASLHYALSKHIDMDEVFHFLINHKNAMIAHPHRAYSEDPRHQKCFVLRLTHLTCVGKRRQPLEWQPMSDEIGWLPKEHQLSRCSVVLALSLEGEPLQFVKNNQERRINKSFGLAYDPLSAWRMLSVEMCPDWESDTTALTQAMENAARHEQHIHGPEAFLLALIATLKDARRRLESVYASVSSLCTPEPDLIFRRELQDQLLFDDEHFTFSRRYLMAHQTLGIVNQDIDQIVSEIRQCLPESIFDGTNGIIWSRNGGKPDLDRKFRQRMETIRKDLEIELAELKALEKLNVDKQKEMKALFDNLYNMTSIQENRRSVRAADAAVQQNRNIKLLTLVTLFFLPLSFSTSIFGMNNFPADKNYYPYAWTTIGICLPTYLLIAPFISSNPRRFWLKFLPRAPKRPPLRTADPEKLDHRMSMRPDMGGISLPVNVKRQSTGHEAETHVRHVSRSSQMASMFSRKSLSEHEKAKIYDAC